jgi:CRP/FNR family transcriptional regulator
MSLSTKMPALTSHDRRGDPCLRCGARPESVCGVIDDCDLHRLSAASVVTAFDPGTSFISEGEPAEHFFNVTDGHAKLYKLLPDGRRQIVGFARRGDFLGLAVSKSYAFGAEAIDRVRVCRFSRRKLEALLDDFPALERQLLKVASNELVVAQEQMLLLGRKTARERVASFLRAREERPVPCGDGTGRVPLPMTRGDIADYLGLTLETVSRTLSQFKRDRLIALPTLSEACLLDREAVTEIAEAAGTAL